MLDDMTYPLAERYQLAVARQEIEYLRRLYATATDGLGRVEDEDARRSGIETYHRIFTTDVTVRVSGSPNPLDGTGPDAWVDVVTNALKDYASTQHLIGTQIVTFQNVEFRQDSIVQGEATMTSYLHAWHEWPDRRMRLVLGTYIDKVRYIDGIGWQIYDMTLQYASEEHRTLDTPV